jgi:hypothetical protein
VNNKVIRGKVRFQQKTGSRSYIAHMHAVVIYIYNMCSIVPHLSFMFELTFRNCLHVF